jgi:hypothetical protein|tara:strand:- start:41 stop:445 length:405 start_codon:yes stop_codon:yes gene_type:complete
MKIILLILSLSFSSFSVAEANSKEWESSKQLHEKLCEIMSEDFFALMRLRQNNQSLVDVLREARKRNQALSKNVFGHDAMSDVMERDWLEYYEQTVINSYDNTASISVLLKDQKAAKARDDSFAKCYKQLVLAK